MTALSEWILFDINNKNSYPTEYGKYLVCRKDGKIHWEVWNNTGWAYNNNQIEFWAVIKPPIKTGVTKESFDRAIFQQVSEKLYPIANKESLSLYDCVLLSKQKSFIEGAEYCFKLLNNK